MAIALLAAALFCLDSGHSTWAIWYTVGSILVWIL